METVAGNPSDSQTTSNLASELTEERKRRSSNGDHVRLVVSAFFAPPLCGSSAHMPDLLPVPSTAPKPVAHPHYGHESAIDAGAFDDEYYEDEYSEEEEGFEDLDDSDEWDQIDFGEHSTAIAIAIVTRYSQP